MVFAGLSLDQAPPYSATMKFFITGFVYALLCGVYLLFNPSFYNPVFIHLFTLGFMAMVMFGAIFQFLPVVGGITFKNIVFLSNFVYFCLNLGIVSFFAAFTTFNTLLFFMATAFLAFGVAAMALSVIVKVILSKTKNISIISIAAALTFLLLGMLLGTHLLSAYGISKFSRHFILLKDIHLHFLLYGWSLILIMGVSFQVIPMFWVSVDYVKKVKLFFVFGMSFLLFLYAISSFYALQDLIKPLILLLASIYAFSIMLKLKNRKRKLSDYSVRFWYIAMISLILSSIAFLLNLHEVGYKVFAYGFIYGVISAMIYKIIPFITWFFLSAKGLFDIPTMKEMIPSGRLQQVFYIYLLGYLTLLLTILTQNESIKIFFAFLSIALSLLHLISFINVIKIYKKYTNS